MLRHGSTYHEDQDHRFPREGIHCLYHGFSLHLPADAKFIGKKEYDESGPYIVLDFWKWWFNRLSLEKVQLSCHVRSHQAVSYLYCMFLVEPLASCWILAMEFFAPFTWIQVSRGGINIVIVKINQFFISFNLKFRQFSIVFKFICLCTYKILLFNRTNLTLLQDVLFPTRLSVLIWPDKILLHNEDLNWSRLLIHCHSWEGISRAIKVCRTWQGL